MFGLGADLGQIEDPQVYSMQQQIPPKFHPDRSNLDY